MMDQISMKKNEEIAEGEDVPIISEGKFITLNMSSISLKQRKLCQETRYAAFMVQSTLGFDF